MNNGTMLKVLMKSNKEMIKGLIKKNKLQENKSFIRVLINEFNYLANISTPDIKQKEDINNKITKLHLIDDIMNQAV